MKEAVDHAVQMSFNAKWSSKDRILGHQMKEMNYK